MNLRPPLALVPALLLLACDKDPHGGRPTGDTARDTGPSGEPACDSGLLDDGGECVPAACGTGTWGDLELDEGTVFVDIAAGEGGDGSQAAPFTSIQAGLDAAGDAGGGLVAVAAGSYQETLELDYWHDGVVLAGRCQDLVTIDASSAAEQAPGIRIDTRTSAVEVSGVTVSGSQYPGLLVGSGKATIRSCSIVRSEYYGVVAYPSGSNETTLTLESCQVWENAGVGVLAGDASTTVNLLETSIHSTRPHDDGDAGFGIEVYGGATLVAEACEVRENQKVGVLAVDSGTTAILRESAIHDTLADDEGRDGHGVQVHSGASLELEDCQLWGNAEVGLLAADTGTSAALLRTSIRDTQLDGDGDAGYGIQVIRGASLQAEACEVVGNAVNGVLARDSHTSVTLQETKVQDTRPDEGGNIGYGINAHSGANLQTQACLVAGNTSVGVLAADSGTSVTLRETTIRDTGPDEAYKSGYGIQVSDGASLVTEACEVSGNSERGVVAQGSGTTVTLRETTIHDTEPDENGQGGYGIVVGGGADLISESCELWGNATAGVVAGEADTEVTLQDTTIQDSRPEANGEYGYGLQIVGGASLEAQACLVSGNTSVGVFAQDSDTAVALRETFIQDTRPDASACFGSGLAVGDGASVEAEACQIAGNTATGVIATGAGTSVALQDTIITATQRGEIYTVGTGVDAYAGARIEAAGLELSSNEGPGLYLVDQGTLFTCSTCILRDNQFAGAVVVADASLELQDCTIEANAAQENLGGGVGIFAEPWQGGPPSLAVQGSVIQDNAIAGVWLSGEGSYQLFGNSIRGGEGWTRQSLTKCGDACLRARWRGVVGRRSGPPAGEQRARERPGSRPLLARGHGHPLWQQLRGQRRGPGHPGQRLRGAARGLRGRGLPLRCAAMPRLRLRHLRRRVQAVHDAGRTGLGVWGGRGAAARAGHSATLHAVISRQGHAPGLPAPAGHASAVGADASHPLRRNHAAPSALILARTSP